MLDAEHLDQARRAVAEQRAGDARGRRSLVATVTRTSV